MSELPDFIAAQIAELDVAPDNPDGWIMLVRSYAVIGEVTKARDALTVATAHFADNARTAA